MTPSERRHSESGSAEALFDFIAGELLKNQNVSAGRMFGTTALKIDGKVFAMPVKGRLVLKLPRDRVEALLSSGAAIPFDPGHGRAMKLWVAVKLSTAEEWLALAAEAQRFVSPH